MKRLQKNGRVVSVVLLVSMVSLVVPYRPCLAALIGTETILGTAKAQVAREHVKEMLARKEVALALEANGISLQEAKARIDALSVEEVFAVEKRLEQLPAGGDALGTFVFAALFVFVVLLVTDIMGYTDVLCSPPCSFSLCYWLLT
jgi:hypothetical protein